MIVILIADGLTLLNVKFEPKTVAEVRVAALH